MYHLTYVEPNERDKNRIKVVRLDIDITDE